MECKDVYIDDKSVNKLVEIDTFWNVKAELEVKRARNFFVEIDTFWNVKIQLNIAHNNTAWVEIDTFWNVKCIEEKVREWRKK